MTTNSEKAAVMEAAYEIIVKDELAVKLFHHGWSAVILELKEGGEVEKRGEGREEDETDSKKHHEVAQPASELAAAATATAKDEVARPLDISEMSHADLEAIIKPGTDIKFSSLSPSQLEAEYADYCRAATLSGQKRAWEEDAEKNERAALGRALKTQRQFLAAWKVTAAAAYQEEKAKGPPKAIRDALTDLRDRSRSGRLQTKCQYEEGRQRLADEAYARVEAEKAKAEKAGERSSHVGEFFEKHREQIDTALKIAGSTVKVVGGAVDLMHLIPS